MSENLEFAACQPSPVQESGFNPNAAIPYGCAVEHIQQAMTDFVNFLGFINRQLFTQNIPRLESLLMPANFSSIVGEFVTAAIPKYCLTLVKNQYHNGHPDLIPAGKFPGNAIHHSQEGIELRLRVTARGGRGIIPKRSG